LMRLSQNWSWNNGAVSFAKDSSEFSAVWAYTPIFLLPSRPLVCHSFQATQDACGNTREEAMANLSAWEILTASNQI
ncbi:MAG: hypothetical protein ABL903_17550, partial [Methylococcales bacterium]